MSFPSNCFCLHQVDSLAFSTFLDRSINDAREYQKILKRIDQIEYMKREVEIAEAEYFLLKLNQLRSSGS